MAQRFAMADPPFSSADFHQVAHKRIVNAVHDTLADAKLDWALVAPLLDAGRELCRADFQEGARIRLHADEGEGGAFLSIAVADRETGDEWLSESYWLADIALADADAAEIGRIAAALELSLAKVKAWLDSHPREEGPADPAEPPPDPD